MLDGDALKILIIDDNRDDRLLARRELLKAFAAITIEEITNPYEFQSALDRNDIGAVVTDYQLGWATGLEILSRIKSKYPDCPVVMFTATANLEQTVEVMKAGLDDYVAKSPKHYQRLPDALRGALIRAEAVVARKRSEQALAEQEQWMNATLRSLREAVLTADVEGRVRSLNPEFERLTGWDAERAVGRDVDEVLHLLDKDGHGLPISPVRLALMEHKSSSDDISNHCVVHISGKRIPVINSVALIEAADGHILGAVTTLRDITDRRKIEKELMRSNEELQQFAYSASHDLQDPLRTMITMSQLLARRLGTSLGTEEKMLVETIETAGLRMAAQLKGLLDYGRVADHAVVLTEFPADEAAQAAIANLQAYIKERRGRVTCDPLPVVLADRAQLTTVFQNLISNGLKYNESETPLVEIKVETLNGSKAIGVRDNGIGIPVRYRSQLFRLFSRLHPSRYPGTGVGLALAKRIVERSGGEILLAPGDENGTTFLLKLP